MTKKYVINPENPNGVEMDMTAEEENQRTIIENQPITSMYTH